MTSYLLVIAVLSFLALSESESNGNRLFGKAACVILILFGGLRYETGFDWVEYEIYYDITQPIWANRPEYVTANLLVEPGFQFYNLLMRSLGASFQVFLFSITMFNMIVIYYFTKKYTNRIAFVLLIYFGFVYLAAQMAALRQTLSYSFVLLAFMYKDDKKIYKSLILLVIASSMHIFSIIFIPLILIRIRTLPIFPVIIAVGFGIGTAFAGFHIVPIAADFLLPILGGGLIATKLALYGDYEGYKISLVSLMFIPLHIVVYFLLTTMRLRYAEPLNRFTSFVAAVTLLSLICHSYFGVFPAFWNRVSYLTFLLQPIALTARYRYYFNTNGSVHFGANVFATTAGVSIIAYTLSLPTSLPFTPYQNAAVAWISGDYGDGRLRYEYAFSEAEREIASRRR